MATDTATTKTTYKTPDDTGYPGCYKCKHRSPKELFKGIRCRLNPASIDIRDKYGHICSYYDPGDPEYMTSIDVACVAEKKNRGG